jgi:hypothetical protein
MAIIARWRSPPDNFLIPFDMAQIHFLQLPPHRHRRIEGHHRILENHSNGSSAKILHLPLRQMRDILSDKGRNVRTAGCVWR